MALSHKWQNNQMEPASSRLTSRYTTNYFPPGSFLKGTESNWILIRKIPFQSKGIRKGLFTWGNYHNEFTAKRHTFSLSQSNGRSKQIYEERKEREIEKRVLKEANEPMGKLWQFHAEGPHPWNHPALRLRQTIRQRHITKAKTRTKTRSLANNSNFAALFEINWHIESILTVVSMSEERQQKQNVLTA